MSHSDNLKEIVASDIPMVTIPEVRGYLKALHQVDKEVGVFVEAIKDCLYNDKRSCDLIDEVVKDRFTHKQSIKEHDK